MKNNNKNNANIKSNSKIDKKSKSIKKTKTKTTTASSKSDKAIKCKEKYFVPEDLEKIEKDGFQIDFSQILGEGSYGTVFCAKMKRNDLEIPLASKIILNSNSSTENIQTEINILKTSSNTNIITMEQSYTFIKSSIIFMEFSSLGSLQKLLTPLGGLEASLHKVLMAQLLRGVQYLHEELNIAHLDLKPENLLIFDENRLKICDFGVSLLWSDDDAYCTHFVGTKRYWSPEIENKEMFKPKPSDIWSIGIISYYCSCKVFVTLELVLKKIIMYKGQYDTDDFKNFINGCLIVSPNKRETAKNLLNFDWLKV